MSKQFISVETDLSTESASAVMNLTNRGNVSAVAIGNLISSSARRRLLVVTTATVDASGTVTFSSTCPTNTQTIVVAGVTITFVTSGATGNQVNVSTTPSVAATRIAALINSSSSFTGLVTATSAAGIVTVVARAGSGVLGNKLTLTTGTSSNSAVSGAVLASGDNGTVQTISLGLSA